MKKKLLFFSLILLFLFSFIAFLNTTVTTKQGIDYQVSTLGIPLYLKILNFYDRHYNYKWLARRITGDLKTTEQKVFRLFQWTHETIRPQPDSLPIMDDHPWNVYVRGYGTSDNFHDIFTTLCHYIEVDGFFASFYSTDSGDPLNLSFLRLEREWVVFDPYNGVYFINKDGDWATLEDIKRKDWKLGKLIKIDIQDSFYEPYLGQISNIEDIGLSRANTQSPMNRLMLQLKEWTSGKKILLE